jgi:hypothetical protein
MGARWGDAVLILWERCGAAVGTGGLGSGMHAGENATAAWLRKVIPLWLVVPLYAVPVLWAHALWGFYAVTGEMGPMFGEFDQNGQPMTLPPLPWGQLGTALSVMTTETMGSPAGWVAVLPPAAVASAAITALHRSGAALPRPGAAARSWLRNLPRLSAAVGATLWGVAAVIAVLAAVFPWVASDYFTVVRERGYWGLGAGGSQQVWIAISLTLVAVVVVNTGLAWLRPPVAATAMGSTSLEGEDEDADPPLPSSADPAETVPGGPTRAADVLGATGGAGLVAGPANSVGAARPASEGSGWESAPSVGSGVFTRPGVLPGTDGVDLEEADLTAYRRPPRGGAGDSSQHSGSQQPPAQ